MPEHIQRVALDFPQLTIVVGHACWPWTTQACALAMRCTQRLSDARDLHAHADMPGAQDYVDAANSYLLRIECSTPRASRRGRVDQALEDFRRLPIAPESRKTCSGTTAPASSG